MFLEATSGNRLGSLRSARDLLVASGFEIQKTSGVYEIDFSETPRLLALGVCLLVTAPEEAEAHFSALDRAVRGLPCAPKCSILASSDREGFLIRSAGKGSFPRIPFLEVLPEWLPTADVPERSPGNPPEPEDPVFISFL